jgi:TP901 family phage tail tape measure protein
MADVQSNIHVNIDTSDALASLKLLQRQISAFHTQMSKSGAAASAVAANQAQNLMNSINATGKFQATMRTVATSTEYFTNALEKNKLTSREYFRYTGAATKTFGRLFKSEFETINKVARERVKDIQTQYIKMGRGANGALQAIAVRPLTLDMKNLATQTQIAAQRQQLLNQLLKQGSTNLLNFGKNTQWAGRQLMVGFTVPLMLLGSTAAKTFMKLEEQAIRFKRVYGEMFTTQEETDAMVKQIQTLAKEYTKYGVAVEKTMEMAANAAAMGKMGAELTAQVTEATRLAVLGGVEQEQALETTISVTNAFGVAAEDLAKKIDFLNAVENQTVVSIEDLTIAIPKAGPVVQQLGGDVEDLAFFLTAMKEGGINASEGANALKSGLASLINPSEKASKMLAGLGINIKGIVEANKGDVAATVVGFSQALDTLDPLNRARAIEQLFGKFQFSRLSTLFKNVTAEGSQAARVLGLTKATTEELAILSQRELDKIENTTTYKFKKSIEDLKVTLAPVGEQFLKALTPIVEFASKILDKFNNLGEGSKKFLTILTVALGAIGPIALMTFGLLANGLANIIKLFATMKTSFNRAGSSTQILGNQTDYLTQQQLEASAVAASLDQVHQKLRQTFTSETAAVNALAAAYQRAIASQLGFTGPVGKGGKGGGIPQSRRYSTGVERVPGPMGAGDIVPALLSPGEAVIPAQAAQDPANRPVITSLINDGTAVPKTKKKRTKPDTVFAHATSPQQMQTKNISDQFGDIRTNLGARGIERALGYRGLGFDIPEEVHKKLTNNTLDVREYEAEIRKARAVETMTSQLMKPPSNLTADEASRVTNKIRKNLILSLQNLPDGTKIGDRVIYSRMGNLKTGVMGGLARDPRIAPAIEKIYSVAGIGAASASTIKYDAKKMAVEDLIKNIRTYAPNTNPSVVSAIEDLAKKAPGIMLDVKRDGDKVVAYERPEVSGKKKSKNPNDWTLTDKRNNGSLVQDKNGNWVFKTGRSGGDTGAVKIGGTAGKKLLEKARAALQGLTAEDIDGRPITTYGKQLEKGTGYSNVAARDASGVFLTEDGKKVYVKPMPDLRAALAEQRATIIARDVHGLEAPKQELRVIKDPYTGKTMFALESAYDPKFTPKELSGNFSREEYFRQLVAANLRGDDDLKKGNLGGNRLVDVGKAGVLDGASGPRGYAERMPSMLEMAEKNLSGVRGPAAGKSPFWFGNATADIAKNMTPDEYHKAMIAEIDRTLPKLKETIAKFNLGPEDQKYYQAMIDRLEEGKKVNWRLVHAKHNAILVKPDELVEDEDGKTEKPKTRRKTRGVKSGSPKDTREMNKPKKGKRIVQGPRGVRVPGFADAPESSSAIGSSIVAGAKSSIAEAKSTGQKIGLTISQSAAAASRTALYGSGPVDANQKSLRRKLEKLERDNKRLNKIAAQAPVPQPVVAANMAQDGQRMTPSGRIKSYIQRREDKRAARVAAGKGPGMGVGGAAMAASGIAMLGSMAPGKVGEISQKIMMPLMGLSMILPMLKSPVMAVIAGLTATVGAFIALRMAFNSAQEKVLQEAEKFRGSTSAIQSIAKFGGKVTASEQMDLRRKNSFSMLGPATGKTTYGEAFAQTKEGKALTENIAKQNAAGKGGQVVSDLTSQLSTAVMSGAMDINQAKSLAMNAAKEAGDMSIGLKVIAQMEKVLGPNGEDLDKNPLEVRTRMIAENQKRMQSNMSNIENAGMITKLAGQKTMQKVGIGASAAGGAAIGATLGAALGSVVPVLGNAVGAIIGGGIGAAAGAIGGYFASKKFTQQSAQLGAAYAVDAKIAMEQNKQMLDSFDLYMEKKVEELRLQGKINEANELQEKLIDKRNDLTAAQRVIQEDIVSQYNSAGGMQESMMSGMKKAAKARYKDNPNEIAYMDVVGAQAGQLRKDGAIDKGQEFLIQAKMASGDIPPSVFRQLLQMATDNKDIAPKMMNIITKFSGATSESIGVAAQNILNAKGDIDKTVQAQFITKVSAFEEDSDALDFAKNMIKLNNLNAVIPSNVLVKYYTENDAAYQQLNTMLDAIEGKKDLTATMVYEIIPQVKGTNAFNEDYFNTLTEDQQKVYTTTIASVINVPDPQIVATDDYQTWLKENTVIEGRTYGGAQYKGLSQAALIAHYKEQQGFKAVTEGASITAKAPVVGGDKSSGNKPKSSPLDDLVKRLRDVRKNQIKVTEGFDASFKSLNKLFGGKKTIDIFGGIENDMRRLGAGEDLIELIVGMDPKEYEKQKNKLFKFDEKGNIIKIKDGAKSIGDALQSVKLGEFVSEQQKMANQIGNQTAALKRLQAAGVEGSVALEAVADATFAAAIANKNLSDEQIKKITKAWNKSTKAKREYAAVEAGIQEKQELTDRVTLLQKITGAFGSLKQEELQAIMDSSALQNLLINFGIDNKDFKDLLQKAVDKARVELKLKQITIEGMQDIFDTGYSNAMEAFDVEETRLRLDFDESNKKLKDEIKKAEELIAVKQEQIRIQEIGLKEIEDQEAKVNEKYDERLKALDEVEKANASISQQQKGQLTLAEALTSGDIAAAARAAQEMRAQSAADAVTKQKDALEKSREYELSQLRSKDGRSRIEIEKEIKKLQDEIYDIEQNSLEPNRETLRLNELALEKAIEGITVLGKTRDAWERIKNEVDLARVSSAQFVKQMQDALDIVKALIAAYNNQKVNTDPIIPAGGYQDPGVTTCPPGFKLVNGNCVKSDTETGCPTGYSMVNGNCVKDETGAKPCPAGYSMVNGNCVKNQDDEGNKTNPCGSGYFLNQEGKCIPIKNSSTDSSTGSSSGSSSGSSGGSNNFDALNYGLNTGGSTAALHLEDLQRLANAVTVANITKNAGQTAGSHVNDLLNMKDRADAFNKEIVNANIKKMGATPYAHLDELTNTPAQKAASAAAFTAEVKAANAKKAADAAAKKKAADDIKKFGGNAIAASQFANWKAMGGLIQRFAMGGFARGTDTVPAMLTPGEFIMSKYAVDSYGLDTMRKINNGELSGGSVYNNTYTLTVNAKTDANPDEIAQAVMATIKRVDDRRIRGVAIGGRR